MRGEQWRTDSEIGTAEGRQTVIVEQWRAYSERGAVEDRQ